MTFLATSFTFHHVSIKTVDIFINNNDRNKFTFHHVSIKTKDQDRKIDLGLSFTFHHVSIKTFMRRIANVRGYNSHSTMYLLKREGIEDEKTIDNDSHSTMYLLKHHSQRQEQLI